MRTSKSTLAGVAAGALVAGVIPFAMFASPANAAEGTASVSPVRYSTTGGVKDSVPNARATFDVTMGGTTSVALTVAPAGGSLTVSDDTAVTLGSPGVNVTVVNNTDDSYVELTAGAAGRYAGSIYDGSDTVAFDFTTVGAPASMTLTPASQTVLVGATADLAVTLLDASGNTTQPGSADSVAMTSSTDDTVAPASLSSATLYAGTAPVTLATAGHAAGTTTVTATPLGTLPSYGLTAQTATVTKSGTISDVAVAGMSVTSPTTGVWNGTAWPNAVAQVAAGTTNIQVTVDDTTAAEAGNQIRLSAEVANGTLNGTAAADTPIYFDVTTDANKQATLDLVLGGGAALAGQDLVVKQVDVSDTPLTNIDITVTQTVATPVGSFSPTGSAVAALGASTAVTVSVDDSLGVAISGATVRAYRGTPSPSTLLTSGVTNSAGEGGVTVTNASTAVDGTVESYNFTYQVPGGSETTISGSLSITYTTDGKITSLSVAPSTGSTFDAAGATVTTLPVSTVVNTTGIVAGTASAGVYTLSSSSVTTAPTTSLVTFAITTTPGNPATVTVPEGVKVSATNPASETTNWDGGAQTATISSSGTAYVWATKTGTHTITVESGGLTATGSLVVVNSSADAYNIALSPESQNVAAGSIGTVDVIVTDVFGNPVQTADDTGAVTVTATGEVLLAGFQPSASFTTDENGVASVTIIAGNSGTGTLTATPKSGDAAPAWQTDYEAPTGASAPVTSAAATVKVSESSVKTITIVGERGTVKGKPGIMVDGITTGFAEGDLMVPYIKFPGQTSYSEGTARPAVDADLEFYWQRKTGKKIYVYFKNEAGDVKSDRIIIQAK